MVSKVSANGFSSDFNHKFIPRLPIGETVAHPKKKILSLCFDMETLCLGTGVLFCFAL